MVIIGDQIVTDIFSGNRFRIKSILVDPLGEKDMKITVIHAGRISQQCGKDKSYMREGSQCIRNQ